MRMWFFWGVAFWLLVNVVMVAVLIVAIRRMKRLEELARLNLKTQWDFEALLIKVLKSGGEDGTSEPKE